MVITQPSLRDTIQTFFRRKFTFLLIFGGACFVGAAYLFFTTPLYRVWRVAGGALRSAHGA